MRKSASQLDAVSLVNFINLTLEEKKMVLSWRNHPKTRRWMHNQDEIKLKDHLNFIQSLQSQKDKIYFLVKKEQEYIGVISFTQLVTKKTVHMGIYSNPNTKGNGALLLSKIIDYSFSTLKVQKLFSEVFIENKRAYTLYESFGFTPISQKTVNSKTVICMEVDKDTLLTTK